MTNCKLKRTKRNRERRNGSPVESNAAGRAAGLVSFSSLVVSVHITSLYASQEYILTHSFLSFSLHYLFLSLLLFLRSTQYSSVEQMQLLVKVG
ncbi:hypothetical protein VNO77_42609 [Canavalia gladiata]|uniref:Uncharacterized protein n=1 Tax=Canavalia gladiata TaxID=3824 RepID=A0AAN9JT62_CANGL